MPYTNPTTRTATGGLTENPLCTSVQNGWYTRSGGPEDNPYSGIRRLIIIWQGVTIYNTTSPSYTDGDYVVIGQYAYRGGTKRGESPYGWNVDDTTCGTASSPSGDHCNSFDVIRYSIQNPQVNSFSITPTEIILGQSAVLKWSTSDADSVSINNGIGAVAANNTNPGLTVTPTADTTYTITASAGNVADSLNASIIVYVPATFTLQCNKESIIAGGQANVSWSHSPARSANTLVWLTGGIDNLNLNSSKVVSPNDTTLYSGYVTGKGGDSAVASVELVVHQIPVLNTFDAPTSVNYGVATIPIEYDLEYTNNSVTVTVVATWLSGPNTGQSTVDTINIPPATDSQLNRPGSQINGTIEYEPTWDDFGPRKFEFILDAQGDGGSANANIYTDVIVDVTPDNFIIPESDDLLRSAEPVLSPDTEIISEQILVDDIDISVEIKANLPIQVNINNTGVWKNLRELG